eukprot:scaffold168523_cov14-Prasinocladus_malaysianus.AAC.1
MPKFSVAAYYEKDSVPSLGFSCLRRKRKAAYSDAGSDSGDSPVELDVDDTPSQACTRGPAPPSYV